MRCFVLAAVLALLTGCGGDDGGGQPQPQPPAPPGAPVFTSALAINAAENVPAAQTVYTATATDPNNDAVMFSIAGGADAARFSILAGGGLSFVEVPDFEAPTDANRDNFYEVTLQASDGALTSRINLVVTVTDINDSPPNAIALRRVGIGLQNVVQIAPIPGDPRVLVLLAGGEVRLLDPLASGSGVPYITLTAVDSIAAAPDFATTGILYATRRFASALPAIVATAGFEVVRFGRGVDGRGDAASADVILRAQYDVVTEGSRNLPISFGAQIAFGPGGLLYVLTAEGATDGPFGFYSSQAGDLSSLFGKVLRIDVSSDAFPGDPNRDYAVPANPGLPAGSAPEIYAYGFAEPERPIFEGDRLLFADEGVSDPRQADPSPIAEINLLTAAQAGGNYGWPGCEGLRPFRTGTCAGTIPPIAAFGAGGTLQFVGGTYTGNQTTLRDRLIFARSAGSSSNGALWAIPSNTAVGTTRQDGQIVLRLADLLPDVGSIGRLGGVGRDAAGNIYVFDADADGEIFVIR